ncbi:Thioesterase/thiol ester dehydrase-isomerase [Piedraia hortae CBS 480.64]|uniref:Thioesterase/thiol ester dehydrase-isomerase n=1 Tax=Piedraia hortae CBS 480.64 TaxID=1314780 RepID=A0A6A7C9J1_9PEZI|nr:Thioesterase/thiol ester dehydrase-isomerase [Piedraia hortae CBS 480.64]
MLSPTHVTATFAFTVDPYYCNAWGHLHGGAQSFMFDSCTSLAIYGLAQNPDVKAEQNGWAHAGVSRSLNVSYLRPALQGEELLMTCEVVHMGKKLALLRGTLQRAKDGAIISTCEHHKVAVQRL